MPRKSEDDTPTVVSAPPRQAGPKADEPARQPPQGDAGDDKKKAGRKKK